MVGSFFTWPMNVWRLPYSQWRKRNEAIYMNDRGCANNLFRCGSHLKERMTNFTSKRYSMTHSMDKKTKIITTTKNKCIYECVSKQCLNKASQRLRYQNHQCFIRWAKHPNIHETGWEVESNTPRCSFLTASGFWILGPWRQKHVVPKPPNHWYIRKIRGEFTIEHAMPFTAVCFI